MRKLIFSLTWGLFSITTLNSYARDVSELSINELLRMSMYHSPIIQSKMQDIAVSSENVNTAMSQFMPTPSVRAENSKKVYDATLSISQPIWTGGKLTSGLNIANAQKKYSISVVEEQRFQIAQQTIQAWGEYVSSLRSLRIDEAGIQKLQDLQRMMKERTKNGLSAKSELDLAEARLMQLRSQYLQDQSATSKALINLSQLVGIELSMSSVSDKTGIIFVKDYSIRTAIDSSVKINPSVNKAEDQVDVAKHEIEKVKSNVMPDFMVKFEHEETNSPTSMFRNDNRIVFSVQQSFGAGFSAISDARGAEAKLRSAELQKEAQMQKVVESISVNMLNLKEAKKNVLVIQEYETSISKTLESYQRTFLAGKRSWMDVLNIVNEQITAKKQLSNSQVQVITGSLLVNLDRGEISWN